MFANLEVLLGGLLHSIVEVKGVRLVLLIPLRWHVAHDEHAAKARVSPTDADRSCLWPGVSLAHAHAACIDRSAIIGFGYARK